MTACPSDRRGFVGAHGRGAERAGGAAYAAWGKGIHPAGLNFGDCFAYVLAMENDCNLLCVGNDFVLTDVETCP